MSPGGPLCLIPVARPAVVVTHAQLSPPAHRTLLVWGASLPSFQVPSKPTLCALLLALPWLVPGWARLSACSVPEVLRHYRAVIFQDLQAAVRPVGPEPGSGYHHLLKKNLTGTGGGRGWPGVSCGAQKVGIGAPIYPPYPTYTLPQDSPAPAFLPSQEHGILLFIESLGQTLRGAVTGGRRGNLEKAAWTVALRTEAVMRRHCWKPRQSRRPRTRPVPRRGGRRRLLLRVLDTVATCWEKLFALRATATGES
ncbi:uncharacterized protein C20orf204 homolog isoform X2 [Sciurus carolinensis]|uniref:uncharacterized protein C20orf204 homolog isoform X2 n=1 Tax=Sciurus carolinensis TaxID=30640 RepID=UPI001FB43C8F|nr:uncharacterized protein C20orf204 homolog isoform X2 [Sciurus carolinensis]